MKQRLFLTHRHRAERQKRGWWSRMNPSVGQKDSRKNGLELDLCTSSDGFLHPGLSFVLSLASKLASSATLTSISFLPCFTGHQLLFSRLPSPAGLSSSSELVLCHSEKWWPFFFKPKECIARRMAIEQERGSQRDVNKQSTSTGLIGPLNQSETAANPLTQFFDTEGGYMDLETKGVHHPRDDKIRIVVGSSQDWGAIFTALSIPPLIVGRKSSETNLLTGEKFMLEFLKTSEGLMKSKLNMESLTKPELLMLFSILEGELEARDLVIDALKVPFIELGQGKELFIQERYGKYNLSDPFQALQRDSEAVGDQLKEPGCPSATSNPLVVLKLVVGHCRRMQEKMLAQLAAAESRHRRVIADLEEEKRRHAEDTAEGDDVTYILEKERERLQQQLEFERSQVRRLEKEQRRMTEQIEEERAQHKQLSCALAKECKWAKGHRLSEVNRKLDKEKESCQALRNELEDERRRALRMEARVEEQLAEFDTEREQLRSRLKKEEAHCCQLQQQVQELKRKLEERGVAEAVGAPVQAERKWATRPPARQVAVDMVTFEDLEEDTQQHEHPNVPDCTEETDGHPDPDSSLSDDICLHNGDEDSPVHQSQASSSNLPPSSPCSSPVLAKRPPGSPSPGSYQSPYQAGINQRFHAARHKFQGTIDPEPQTQAAQPALPPSPKDAPPVTSSPPLESSPVKQMARSTVTQVLSRFTSGQQNAAPKSTSPNNSPFGTDYRSLAAPLSPVIAGPQGSCSRGSDHPPSPGPTGATLHPSPPRSPVWLRPPPPRPQCPGLPDSSLTPPSQAAAASLPARRESKNWTWWCLPTNGSFDSSVN
ncbi:hypothetical protein F7725_017307 [Dissostichus mawsoni]|uniref:Cortactin-binding protein-2 N-terminal domain-containing protein n=1 Tax=Dissostichus mawsoni TaxID=36200 RepID=A0A7J5Z465_DISMA|nr:hypothetical protein F7725_017307 [Dissostichus mawsoni]